MLPRWTALQPIDSTSKGRVWRNSPPIARAFLSFAGFSFFGSAPKPAGSDSAQDLLDHAAGLVVEQRLLAAVAAVDEPLRVEAEQVQQRGMEIVLGHDVG